MWKLKALKLSLVMHLHTHLIMNQASILELVDQYPWSLTSCYYLFYWNHPSGTPGSIGSESDL
jgi:hypothetical protein